MDASRYTAFEDGYRNKYAFEVPDFLTPKSPGYTGQSARELLMQNPAMQQKYEKMKPEYFDMAAADLNKDWLLGTLSDTTMRKWFSTGGLGLLGGGLGAAVGGWQGLLIGGTLGALAGYLMEAFDIGLPDAYQSLFKARSEGMMQDTFKRAAAELKKKGKDPEKVMGYTEAKEIINADDETNAQLVTNNKIMNRMKDDAQAKGDKKEELLLAHAIAKNEAEAERRYVEQRKGEVGGTYEQEAMGQDVPVPMREAFRKVYDDITERMAKLEVEKVKLQQMGADTSKVDGQLKALSARLADTENIAKSNKPDFESSWDQVDLNPFQRWNLGGSKEQGGFNPFGSRAVGAMTDFEEALAKTKSRSEALALAQAYNESWKRSRRARYGEGDTGSDLFRLESWNEPNESMLPFSNNYAGFTEEHLDPKYLYSRAKKLGVQWEPELDREPVVPSQVIDAMSGAAPKAPGYKKIVHKGAAPKTFAPAAAPIKQKSWKQKAVESLVGKADKKYLGGSGFGPKMYKRWLDQNPEKAKELGIGDNSEWKEFAGDDTPMWWEVLIAKHAMSTSPGISTPEENKAWQEWDAKTTESTPGFQPKFQPPPTPSSVIQQQLASKIPIGQTKSQPDLATEAAMQAKPGIGMQKEFSSNRTPMWWDILNKAAGLPADPQAMAETPEPIQTAPTQKDVFDFQREMANKQMDMQAKKIDMQKTVVENQSNTVKANADMTNKRMDMQNQQVQNAQQQATAQNPAVNSSPQQPTGALNMPTAGAAPNSPTMNQAAQPMAGVV